MAGDGRGSLNSFGFRAELEHRAHGNPSWNTGVDYGQQLALSADRREVEALYRQADLDLGADLTTLAQVPRIQADTGAIRYLSVQRLQATGGPGIRCQNAARAGKPTCACRRTVRLSWLYQPHSADELTRSGAILKISRGVRRW